MWRLILIVLWYIDLELVLLFLLILLFIFRLRLWFRFFLLFLLLLIFFILTFNWSLKFVFCSSKAFFHAFYSFSNFSCLLLINPWLEVFLDHLSVFQPSIYQRFAPAFGQLCDCWLLDAFVKFSLEWNLNRLVLDLDTLVFFFDLVVLLSVLLDLLQVHRSPQLSHLC